MLAISRIMVAWQPLGLAMGTYDMCNRYLQQRQQFGSPLAAFQVGLALRLAFWWFRCSFACSHALLQVLEVSLCLFIRLASRVPDVYLPAAWPRIA